MSGAVLLILMFYILGLFYGMCGSAPSEVRKQVLKYILWKPPKIFAGVHG